MLRADSAMELTIKKIYDVMRTCKIKLKHRATLRKLTNLSPITANERRWTGKYEMVKRLNTIRDELIDVADDEDCDLEIDTSPKFKRIALRCEKQLGQMSAVTTELQKAHPSLSECRFAIDSLLYCSV